MIAGHASPGTRRVSRASNPMSSAGRPASRACRDPVQRGRGDRVRRPLRQPAVADLARPAQDGFRVAANTPGCGAPAGLIAGVVHPGATASNVIVDPPQRTQQHHCSVLRAPRLPTTSFSTSYSTGFQPTPTPAAVGGLEHVHLGGLLGHQRGLPLRQDQHAGDPVPRRRDRREVAERTRPRGRPFTGVATPARRVSTPARFTWSKARIGRTRAAQPPGPKP